MACTTETGETECSRCGACCVAPDIAALGKGIGERCPHLTDDLLCAIYEDRPDVCRAYRADDLCFSIEAPDLSRRVRKYLEIFGLEREFTD
ncbi:MAG: zinc/iron-chelating domain-containing protein [Gemmatimonadetes bacterium]|nr:zinc/iron-chelating domain-containing protein [Gemmatimonadota bacterium]